MMLITRQTNESIRIGDDIIVTVVRIKDGTVRIGITAPPAINVAREELLPPIEDTTHNHGGEA